MKILIIHAIDNLNSIKQSLFNFSFCLLKYAPENDYFLHCFGSPITEELVREEFDAIILDVTFLYNRVSEPEFLYPKLLQKYEFIKYSKAIKVALPQDDYNHSKILQQWLEYFDVNIIFTACYKSKDIIYSSLINKIDFIDSLTGYVDEDDKKTFEKYIIPFDKRKIDISFRSKTLNPAYGRHGQIKSNLSNDFNNAISKLNTENLNIDVSNNLNDAIYGEEWLKFLANTKFSLGCESGSSILDPYGKILNSVQTYLKLHPKATFEEVESNCFPDEDNKYSFNVISPRVFEAAMAKSCQILIEGEYNNIIKPWKHYIPLKKDYSNIKEVLDTLKDTKKINTIINESYKELILFDKYSYNSFANRILQSIYKHTGTLNNDFNNLLPHRSNREIQQLLRIGKLLHRNKGYIHLNNIYIMNKLIKKLLLFIINLLDSIELYLYK